MAVGKWEVFVLKIGNERFYRVGRVINTSKPPHIGNVEYATDYSELREDLDAMAKELNEKEEQSPYFIICPICKHRIFVKPEKGGSFRAECTNCGTLMCCDMANEQLTDYDKKKADEQLQESLRIAPEW